MAGALFIGANAFAEGAATLPGAGDPEAGAAKASQCAGCHGVDGNSVSDAFPALAGRSAGYLAKQLKDFRDGVRTDPIMSPQALKLTDTDIANLAAYFSGNISKGSTAKADEETLEKGRKIYLGGNRKRGVSACMSCHGPAGHGIPPRFPKIGGQHGAYIQKQLLAFRDDARTNDSGIMTSIAERMTLGDVKAVSQYIAGLR
ncbi:MAG: cytochrome c4 [Gammaproteobacteria bacterium]|nr:MAG: cytochrome c4 [Gammaproteobacteria bacterium]